MLTGAEILIEVLRSEGVRHVFGNPGSTELALIDAVERSNDIRYVLGLHESCVIPMADGYAQATGRPAFVNVHTMSGLGNALGALTNAAANGTPLVVTAGQQHQGFLVSDPLLSYDLVRFSEPVCKWAAEVHHVDDLSTMLRRAFQDSMTAPTGPVFLSLPVSVMEARTDCAIASPSRIERRTVPAELDALADALAEIEIGKLAIVLGQEIAHSGAVGSARDLAHMLGAPVFSTPLVPVGVFPPTDPMWHGTLPHSAASIRKRLAHFERIFFVGGLPFIQSIYTRGSPIPEGCTLVHLSPDGHQLARAYPVTLGVIGDPKASIEALLLRLRGRISVKMAGSAVDAQRQVRSTALALAEQDALKAYDRSPMPAVAAIHCLLRSAPTDVIVVDEAVSSSFHIRALHLWEQPGSIYSGKQIIGWGMPAAIGISLATSSAKPVLCIASDGGATFSLQALWTAAHEDLPIVFAILVNREYGILRTMTRAMRPDAQTEWKDAFDLSQPPIDYVMAARSMGIDGRRVEHTNEIQQLVSMAFAARKPFLIEVPVARN